MAQDLLTTPRSDDAALRTLVADVLDRWPSAGVAVTLVRADGTSWSTNHGYADVASRQPMSPDTVLPVGSVTKVFTAIALMQLWERGAVHLDAPVAGYLRDIRLLPARPGLSSVTCRHLLTHTAGLGYWPRPTDLLRPGLGAGVEAARPVASPAEYYRRGLPVEVEPGTKWMYSNHGFAVLGQVVEDVSGEPFDRYLREHVLRPLGMESSDLVLSPALRSRLATGYVLGRDGLRPVPHRAVPAVGGGALCSTPDDMARFLEALLRGGGNRYGSVLRPDTLDLMFRPHFQPDPRIPGMGLAFHRGTEDGHPVVGHDGVVRGFLAQLGLAPDDGVGVVVLTNTGGLDARGAATPLGTALLRHQLGLPPESGHVAARPEVWSELCGRYGLAPGPMTNLFLRLVLGAGVEVRVRDRGLVLLPLHPVPALRRGMPLRPADPDDPSAFSVDMSEVGKPPMPVVFAGGAPDHPRPDRLCFGETVLHRRPSSLDAHRWGAGLLASGAVALTARAAVRRCSARETGPDAPPSTQ